MSTPPITQRLLRLLTAAFLTLALLAVSAGLQPAQAAVGDACVTTDLQPGELDGSLICVAVATPTVGLSCGSTLYFDGAQCVANDTSCDFGGEPGTYTEGVCAALATGPDGTAPTPPEDFTLDANAGSVPSGTQPMCVNASPFIGGGVFVVSGTVLCYTGAGKTTDIYAYEDANSGGISIGPVSMGVWNSLTMKDLYASDDITALGTLSIFGGAQIYSLDGNSGLQINDNGLLMGSGDDLGNFTSLGIVSDELVMSSTDGAGNLSSLTLSPEQIALASTDGTSSASLLVDGTSGISIVGDRETGGAAVSLYGSISDTNTARIGVLVSGDGQGDGVYSGSGTAPWSDVLIASKNYLPDGSLGSGIIVNDYGVAVRSATDGSSYNEFGSGVNGTATSSITNVIGDGGLGSVENYIGRAGAEGTTVINQIGTAGGTGATDNRIGNSNTDTIFSATAGDSSMVVIHGALDFVADNGGASILPSATQLVSGGTLTSMAGSVSRYAVTDSNGRVTVVEGPVPEANSATYVVNGNGIVNAVTVTERNAVLSGGEENPTTMMLSDSGAHFSNSTNGEPVVVSGIADGDGPFDAANIRQLDSGLASVAALAGLPAPQQGKANSIGVAFGHHGSGSALAMGGQSLIGSSLSMKYGAAVAYSSGLFKTSASLGLGMSW